MLHLSFLVSLGPYFMGWETELAGDHLLNAARTLPGQGMGYRRWANIEFFGNAGQGPTLFAKSCFNVFYVHRNFLPPSNYR
jgi:hypothetical protein